MIEPLIKGVTSFETIELRDMEVDGGKFDREHFFKLSDIQPEFNYFIIDCKLLHQKSIDYLKTFIDENTLIIGFEIGQSFRNLLTLLNIKYINFWIHSFKLAPDLMFLSFTNIPGIFEILKKYQHSQELIKSYGRSIKHSIQTNTWNKIDLLINPESLLIIGQSSKDQSIVDNGKFLSLLDYKDKIISEVKKFKYSYYLPHIYDPIINNELKTFLDENNIKIITYNVYHLLASINILKIIAISSSVIYEARIFDKNAEYLFKPLFNIDDNEFDINNAISHYKEIFSSAFWSDIFNKVENISQTTGIQFARYNLYDFSYQNNLL